MRSKVVQGFVSVILSSASVVWCISLFFQTATQEGIANNCGGACGILVPENYASGQLLAVFLIVYGLLTLVFAIKKQFALYFSVVFFMASIFVVYVIVRSLFVSLVISGLGLIVIFVLLINYGLKQQRAIKADPNKKFNY